MSVLDFSALFSDVHSPLNCKLVFNSIDNIVECDDILINDLACHERKGFKKCDCEKEAEFLRNIDRNKIDQLNNDLTMLNTSILAQENINKIVESVNGLMLDSAEKVFGSFTYKRHEKKCRKKVISKDSQCDMLTCKHARPKSKETLEKLFDNQRTFLQEQFVKQNALVGECLSMLKTLEKRPENGKQLNKSKNEIHVPAYIKQSVRDGFKHNKTTNGLKWTTKTAAGTVLKTFEAMTYTHHENKEHIVCRINWKQEAISKDSGLLKPGHILTMRTENTLSVELTGNKRPSVRIQDC
ncbi:unnamed protein product [Mytilus edulis]|uniref:Uncharacterized protein n=1 Tax=Mytilus edulis TaxID=6550 RepID=A0A8S3UE00_MYTED|nr:unnamed protein product [Mytilus edulis]